MTSVLVRSAIWPVSGWLLVLVPLVALIAQLWPALHRPWTTTTTYSHGYLVLGLAAWLAVREFRRGQREPTAPSWTGLSVLAVVAGAAFLATAADVALVQELAIPALLVATAWAGAGFGAARRAGIPAGYLCFAITAWDYLTEPLQAMTTAAVGSAARLTAIPVHIVGNMIHVPSGVFEIAGGCSGLHYAIVATALGAYWGLLQYERVLPRLAFCAVALGVALLANWVRVYLIVRAGHLTEMQHSWVTGDHTHVGWVVFAAMMGPLLLFAHRFEGRRGGGRRGSDRAPQALLIHPGRPFVRRLGSTAGRPVVPLAGLVLLGIALVNAWTDTARSRTVLATFDVQLPGSIGGWRLAAWERGAVPRFQGADIEARGHYVSAANVIDVYVAGYVSQRQGAELIYYANRAVSDAEAVVSRSSSELAFDDGTSRPFRRLEVEDRDGGRRLVWLSYEVAGSATDSDLLAKWYQVLGAVRGRHDAQAIVLSIRCSSSCAEVDHHLETFARSAASTLVQAASGSVRRQGERSPDEPRHVRVPSEGFNGANRGDYAR